MRRGRPRHGLMTCALTLALACSAGHACAGGFQKPPYIEIRVLEALQDRITAGDSVAAAAHAKAISRTAVAFAKANPAVWKDVRNARALALYLFSGGNATVIADAVSRDSVAKDQQVLFDGALAYGLGHDDEARDKLIPIDPRSLPTALGGHLALVQASLLASSDKPKAIELLDLARLLEPGTLVEEASLRKELMLLGTDDASLTKFALLTRRYAGTFRQSLYADNFRSLVTQAALQAAAGDSADAGIRLVKIVGNLEPAERKGIYLSIARRALVDGHLRIAAFASDEAGRLLRKGDPDDARATLYFGAATIVGPHYDQGLRALKATAATDLNESDQALRQSALAIADTIRDPAFASRPTQSKTQDATLGAGERALGDAEAMLKRTDP